MNKSQYILRSFLSATGVIVYTSLVVLLMSNGQTIFGNSEKFLVPLFMLLLFVVSASITGLLVLGKPILLYLDGLKKEAIILFFSTLGWLIIFLLVIVAILLII